MEINKIKTIVFYLPYIGLGGTETLVMRLSQWYSSNGNRVIILSYSDIINSTMQEFTFRNNVEYGIYNQKKKTFYVNGSQSIDLKFLPLEIVSVISFSLLDFF